MLHLKDATNPMKERKTNHKHEIRSGIKTIWQKSAVCKILRIKVKKCLYGIPLKLQNEKLPNSTQNSPKTINRNLRL